ncbi:MAG TPA: ABC transporter substrate-binding protein [Casimicrobiaceae bacterium]|nr:ABC transporter substrate-binding protein [Casimicrobiaceae bacterium]
MNHRLRSGAWRFAIALATALAPVVPLAADMTKTLRVAFSVAENGFDPQAVYDSYSFYVCHSIFDPLYGYDYFARPVRLVPNTAASLPQITDGGRTFTVKVRPGIYFADDPAFKGKRRELTAEDYVYSIKRIFDPKVRSYWLYLFDQRLVGLDEALERARRDNRFDYDRRIDGLQTLDRYTLRIRFKDPYYAFAQWLSYDGLAAVAREVVEAYKDDSNRVMDHPVGTGPYGLKSWTRGQKIVLEANRGYRDETYPAPGEGGEPGDAAIARANAGRKLPIVGRVEISIIEEALPQLLAFNSGQLDYIELPRSISNTVLSGGKLRPEYANRGVTLHRKIDPALSFWFFNLDDPVVGGYTPDKIALRRAIALGYDRQAEIDLVRQGQGVLASQLVPPGIPGHDPTLVAKSNYDPAAARALLDRFGYKDRDGDGYRELPDGKPLAIVKASTPEAVDRTANELWKKDMDAIGIRMSFFTQKWPELNKMSEAGQLQMWGLSWIASVPEPDGFATPLYSKTIGTQNDARFRLPAFDQAFEASQLLSEGPERTALYRRMTELVQSYTPWILVMNTYSNVLVQPWLEGYKQNPFQVHEWKYYDVARERSNRFARPPGSAAE